jgi:hypothetical protein
LELPEDVLLTKQKRLVWVRYKRKQLMAENGTQKT